MTLKALKQRAKSEGIAQDAIDDIDDTEHPKQTAIKLIVDQINKKSSLEGKQREELSNMSLKALKTLARDEKIDSSLIDKIDDEENPKIAAIALILAHRNKSHSSDDNDKRRRSDDKDKVGIRGSLSDENDDDDDEEEIRNTTAPGVKEIAPLVKTVVGRMRPIAENSIAILPTTKWQDSQPSRSFLEELEENSSIRASLPDVDSLIEDIKKKLVELSYIDEVAEVVAKMSESAIAGVLAYTHDKGTEDKAGHFYYELNNSLRERQPAARNNMMKTWGVVVHYILKGLSKLPDAEGILIRGLPNRSEIVKQYKLGRPIQWGAFVSTTNSIKLAKGFSDKDDGIIVKISGGQAKVLGAMSFYPSEDEAVLSPNASFTVCKEASQSKSGWWQLELVQQQGKVFVF